MAAPLGSFTTPVICPSWEIVLESQIKQTRKGHPKRKVKSPPAVVAYHSPFSHELNSLARHFPPSRIEKNELIDGLFVAHAQVSLGPKKFLG